MAKFNQSGERLLRRVTLKAYLPDGGHMLREFQAGPKNGFPPAALDRFVAHTVAELEAMFPKALWRVVELGEGKYKFVSTPADTNIIREISPLLVTA